MGKGNWIKLNRSIRKHFLWDFSKPLYLMAWVDILMEANYTDKKVIVGESVIVVPRGSFITSYRKLATRWQCSKDTVKRILSILEADGMITIKADSKHTTVTVENYALYQDVPDSYKDSHKDSKQDTDKDDNKDSHKDTDKDSCRTISGHLPDEIKNNKELYKNIKNREEREEARARGGGEGADEKDDFHKMLEDNQELFNRLREKRSKGECDAG